MNRDPFENEPPEATGDFNSLPTPPQRPKSSAEPTPQSAVNPLQSLPDEAELTLVEPTILFELGDFQIRRKLGQGTFGAVYLAFEKSIQREVAVKIPHHLSILEPTDIRSFLREAQAAGALDHAHILPVYQVSGTPEHPLFLVTKYVKGGTLRTWYEREQPTFRQVAEIIAKIADALHHAHAHKTVHRDVKPGNILVDESGQPFVADFGLAIREFDPESGPAYAGTPAYMSPEQARGEGHRIDGRSDVFSLGVVLYQLLTGVRPFPSFDFSQGVPPDAFATPEDPSSKNPAVPRELSRICMRALSEVISERYSAAELAVELRVFVQARDERLQRHDSTVPAREDKSTPTSATAENDSITQAVAIPITPRGLRPYERDDSEFFLRLLPGPYDRDGLPLSLGFWKKRMESREFQMAFHVGVIYGPSGCGKTSMLRAGLLPRLDDSVISVYVEASPDRTESDILDALSEVVDLPSQPTIPGQPHHAQLALPQTFAWIRRHPRRKIVLCLDQFEQWLFRHGGDLEQSPLVQALRQCDGVHLQCVLLVRDDFWLSAKRLMRTLDYPILENHNAAVVDLFDRRHARYVLALLGGALGRLPHDQSQLTHRQKQFLDSAIESVAVDGRVICVHLTLLAEMLKDRDWNDPAFLSREGRTGLGVQYLEQTFDLETSPRRFRDHAEGAQRVLRCLLPDVGVRIKGAQQTERELLKVSRYKDISAFHELMHLLDAELHLITPTDRQEAQQYSADTPAKTPAVETAFQLTHDFLIPAIRRWLELRQMSTVVGQTQNKLENFADLYKARPTMQFLPNLLEYLSIRVRLRSSEWNQSQQRMMAAARKKHLLGVGRWAGTILACVLLALFGWSWITEQQTQLRQQAGIDRLLVATWPEAIRQSREFRTAATTPSAEFHRVLTAPGESRSKQVRAALVLAPHDKTARQLLLEYLRTAPPQEIVQVSAEPGLAELLDLQQIRSEWQVGSGTPGERLRLAALLARQPESQALFLNDPTRLVSLLIDEDPLHLIHWFECFELVGPQLVPTLSSIYESISADSGSRTWNTASLLARYARNRPELLTEFLTNSGPTGFRTLVNELKKSPNAAEVLHAQLATISAPSPAEALWLPDADNRDWWYEPGSAAAIARGNLLEQPTLLEEIRSSAGMATAEFVLVQSLPVAALPALDAQLASFDYRLASVCPYQRGDVLMCMACWKRDGRRSAYAISVTAADLRDLHQNYASAGYFADDVVAYSTDDCETLQYAAVWTTTPPLPGVSHSELYVNLSEADHEQLGWGPLLQRGFVPRANVLTSNSVENSAYTSVRWKLAEGVNFQDDWNQATESFRGHCDHRSGCLLVHARWGVRPRDEYGQGLSVIWWDGLPLESRWIPFQSLTDHGRECELLAEQGFRPFSSHVRMRDAHGPPEAGSTWWRPLENLARRTEQKRQQARLILGLLELGDDAPALEALASQSDAELRGAVVDGFSRYLVDPRWLIRQITRDADPAVARAAASALAIYRPGPSRNEVAALLRPRLSELTETNDAGLRSALQTLSRVLQLPAPEWKTSTTTDEFTTGTGHRMRILSPPEIVEIGSACNEPGRDVNLEMRVPVRLERDFAISVHEVTVEEFRKFRESVEIPLDYSPTTDCPVISINWFEAAQYCRWLSEQEGVPESEMCYPAVPKIASGMTVSADRLKRTGYRLPTSAEWEYAAQGGYAASRHFGAALERLPHYAWTAQNSDYHCHPVESLLPNDYGLYDMLGNAMEWCDDVSANRVWPGNMPQSDPAQISLTIAETDPLVSRGGACLYQPLDARVAHVDQHRALTRDVYLSFRIARTMANR